MPSIDEQQIGPSNTALTTQSHQSTSLSLSGSQDVIIIPISGQTQQNATCPIPCFLKSSCQNCIEAQCMYVTIFSYLFHIAKGGAQALEDALQWTPT